MTGVKDISYIRTKIPTLTYPIFPFFASGTSRPSKNLEEFNEYLLSYQQNCPNRLLLHGHTSHLSKNFIKIVDNF